MLIETYEVGEVDSNGSSEQEPEALRLIEELGLEGQKSLLCKTDEGTLRVPYEKMTREQLIVYTSIFPEHSRIERYSAGPIPVRILQVIAHGKELFERLEIWGPQVTMPDPILVGILKNEHYLLARWGNALAPFAELKEKAINSLRERFVAKAQEEIASAQGLIANPDAEIYKYITGGWSHYA